MIKRLILFILLGTLPWISFAQERVVVKDPEIQFSLTKPKGWKTYDDELYYLVYKPTIKNAYVSITYVETDEGGNLDEDFEFAVNQSFPLNIDSYSIIERGDDTIDGIKAKWVKYRSKFEDVEHLNIYYMFEKDDQVWKTLGTSPSNKFNGLKEEFVKIIKSIRSKKSQ